MAPHAHARNTVMGNSALKMGIDLLVLEANIHLDGVAFLFDVVRLVCICPDCD